MSASFVDMRGYFCMCGLCYGSRFVCMHAQIRALINTFGFRNALTQHMEFSASADFRRVRWTLRTLSCACCSLPTGLLCAAPLGQGCGPAPSICRTFCLRTVSCRRSGPTDWHPWVCVPWTGRTVCSTASERDTYVLSCGRHGQWLVVVAKTSLVISVSLCVCEAYGGACGLTGQDHLHFLSSSLISLMMFRSQGFPQSVGPLLAARTVHGRQIR
jgi:hypothetical protein